MSADTVLTRAREYGFRIEVKGGELTLIPTPPPRDLLDLIEEFKPAIIQALSPPDEGVEWGSSEWKAYFNERTGIAQFTQGLTRYHAETLAFRCCVTSWIIRSTGNAGDNACQHCHSAEGRTASVLDLGVRPGARGWLHPECWRGWRAAHEAQAIAALRAHGIGSRTMGESGR